MTYVKTKLQHSIDIDAIITLHYFEYMKNFEFKGESHNFWEFLYVDKGTVAVRADDTWTTLYTGDIIFHQPNEFHAIKSIGKDSPNLVAISFTSSSQAMSFFVNKSFTLSMEERAMISRIITEGRHTLATPMHIPSIEQVQLKEHAPFGSQQMILLYLEMFLITLIREHQEESGASIQHKSSPEEEERLSEILKYLEYHICEKLAVKDICNEFSMSRSAVQLLFHEQLNCGVIDYFNQMKIQRAKAIIRDGSMNLTEIAYFLSYSSLPYFFQAVPSCNRHVTFRLCIFHKRNYRCCLRGRRAKPRSIITHKKMAQQGLFITPRCAIFYYFIFIFSLLSKTLPLKMLHSILLLHICLPCSSSPTVHAFQGLPHRYR